MVRVPALLAHVATEEHNAAHLAHCMLCSPQPLCDPARPRSFFVSLWRLSWPDPTVLWSLRCGP
jgi:hypothetical protein